MVKKVLTEGMVGALTSASDETYLVTLISPGKGSSGFYTESAVRTAQTAFPQGTHVYLDHDYDKAGRVSRSPSELVGVLTNETFIAEDGSAKNYLKPLPHWKDFVEAVAPYTGLSISAAGNGADGEIDGDTTFVVEELLYSPLNSVDLVSRAGRGGGFDQLAESLMESAIAATTMDHPGAPDGGSEKEGYDEMAVEEKLDQLITAFASLPDTIKSALAPAEVPAMEAVEVDLAAVVESARMIEGAEIPASVKDRISKGVAEGTITDVKAEIESYKELADSMRKELTESIGAGFSGSEKSEVVEVEGW